MAAGFSSRSRDCWFSVEIEWHGNISRLSVHKKVDGERNGDPGTRKLNPRFREKHSRRSLEHEPGSGADFWLDRIQRRRKDHDRSHAYHASEPDLRNRENQRIRSTQPAG